jgi:hypothetical protein
MPSNRVRLSRDTRLLLAIVVVAVTMLWVLARIRFSDRPQTKNPVAPVLAQITPPPSAFEDITARVAELQPRVQPAIVAVTFDRADALGGSATAHTTLPALRFRRDLALALVPRSGESDPFRVSSPEFVEIARDPASQLAVLRLSAAALADVPTWPPWRLAVPRFIVVADVSGGVASLRPVFVASLIERVSPIWLGPVWILPAGTSLPSGTFVFNTDGTWVGLTATDAGDAAIVPAERVLAVAEDVLRAGERPLGRLGVEVQRLTPAISKAIGVDSGVVVSWVDPDGPSAGQIAVADAIEAIEGEPVANIESWLAHTARLLDQQSIVLSVRRRGEVHDVTIAARADSNGEEARPLGLTLRTIPETGATVVQVDARSAAARAGLRVGDVLTIVGDSTAPTAAQALRAFRSASPDRPILIAVTRGDEHHVVALQRTW